ncbi:hypothetical protein MKX03_001235, partial [Papaver bracteatum]
MGFSLDAAGGNGDDLFLLCSIIFLTGYGGLRPTPSKLHNKCLRKVPKETK